MPPHHAAAYAEDLGSYLPELYRRLYRAYGPQGWWPGDGPTDVVIGAILTQSASWKNVELALANLKANECFSLEAIHRTPQEELARIVRPSGYYNAKARKLKAFASYITENYSGDLEDFLSQETGALRSQLLSIHGIGPETADDILLYAANKPSFVIDAYTRRILERLGLARQDSAKEFTPKTYGDFQALFHANLAPDAPMFQEFHALLDRHAKEACAKTPKCGECPLLDICPTGASLQSAHASIAPIGECPAGRGQNSSSAKSINH